MEALLATSPSWLITVVRVVLGVIFFAHGSQMLSGRGESVVGPRT
jgi:uncharacterized membrane protein YphA (DoxX/SURF4 family)